MHFDLIFERIVSINESKNQAYSLYVDTKKVPEDIFNKLVEADPTKTKKYIEWMCKQYVSDPERITHIIDVVILFDKLVNKKLIISSDSDINKYKTLDEIDSILASKSELKTKSEEEREVKTSGIDKVYEDEQILVVHPKTYVASCKYGAGTKWCTASVSRDHWDSYWNAGINLYYIMDKVNNKKYAVAVGPDGTKECFTETDKSLKYDKLKSLLVGK